jgi:hypothetical protein
MPPISISCCAFPDLNAIFASEPVRMEVEYTGLVTTALALWVESIAFAKVPATDASINLTMETLIAAGFGAMASRGDTFGMSNYVGASMIVGACVAATVLDAPGSEEATAGCVCDCVRDTTFLVLIQFIIDSTIFYLCARVECILEWIHTQE